jgi:ABC-type oligopeptide transport system substrate-binding subunit
LALSIDRNRFADILHGGQVTAGSFVPPPLLASSQRVGLGYDPARGREELKASGFSGARMDLLMPNGEKQSTLGQFIQAELKKNLGIEVNLQNFDHKTFRAQLDLHQYAAFLLSWSGDYPDPDNFLSLWLGSSGNNKTNWKNASYDDLVTQARFLRNTTLREKKYLQAEKLLQEDDAIVIPLYYEPQQALVKKRVQGLELNPLNYLLLRKVSLVD